MNQPQTSLTAGVELDRRDVRLTQAAALLWCEATAVPFDTADLHPSLAYHVAMEAVDYPALFRGLHVSGSDRAVAGEISIELAAAVQIDQDYEVSAVLDSIEHKSGARTGPFERVTVRSSARRAGVEEADFSVTASILITRGDAR